jgi:trehalose 6-phosphate phosphatase
VSAAPARLPLPPMPGRQEPWALYLDLDGTLCPLAPHPDQVRVGDGLRRLLARLHRDLDGALCILSGRPVRQLEALLPGLEGVTLVGCHGAEGLDDGSEGNDAGTALAIAAARRTLARGAAGLGGVWIEDKPSGFALHYRDNPGAAPPLRSLVARELARSPALRGIEGACVMEILPAGHSKGAALRALARRPERDGRRPVAVGDDITDEDAFVAADELQGFGVCVGSRRPTAARYGLPCVALTQTWLQMLADALEVR